MTLREAVDRYVAWQRDYGAKFRSSAETLDTLCRRIGENRDCDTVGEDENPPLPCRQGGAHENTCRQVRNACRGSTASHWAGAM